MEAARLGQPGGDLLGCYFERRPDLLRFLIARTGVRAEAEDLLQDLYIRVSAVSGRSADADIVDPAAYLYRLCLNLASDRRRARMRSDRRNERFVETHADIQNGEMVSDSPSPETAAESRLRLEKILSALEGMPPQQRRVFRLHRIQGMSHKEVSESLGISISAVEKHMIAALRRLATWKV